MGGKGKKWMSYLIAVILPIFPLMIGVWLIFLYANKYDEIRGDGFYSACLKGDSKVDQYVLGQGLLFVLSILVGLGAGCVAHAKKDDEGVKKCVHWTFLLIMASNFGLWIWGQVEVWGRSSKDECGDFLYEARFYIVMTYVIIGLVMCCTPCFSAYSKKHGIEDPPRFVLLVLLFLFVLLFLVVLFDASLSEIKRMRHWVQGRCKIDTLVGSSLVTYKANDGDYNNTRAAAYSCCSKQCGGCDNCPDQTDCGFLMTLPNATPGDFLDGIGCNGGKHCCQQCCTSSQHSTSCHCCKEISHRCCRLECQWCYRPSYTVLISTTADVFVGVGEEKYRMCDSCKKHGCEVDNLKEMALFLKAKGNTLFLGFEDYCWYDPSNPSKYEWEISYSPTRWFLLAIPMTFIAVILVALVASCACDYAESMGWKSRAAPGDNKVASKLFHADAADVSPDDFSPVEADELDEGWDPVGKGTPYSASLPITTTQPQNQKDFYARPRSRSNSPANRPHRLSPSAVALHPTRSRDNSLAPVAGRSPMDTQLRPSRSRSPEASLLEDKEV